MPSESESRITLTPYCLANCYVLVAAALQARASQHTMLRTASLKLDSETSGLRLPETLKCNNPTTFPFLVMSRSTWKPVQRLLVATSQGFKDLEAAALGRARGGWRPADGRKTRYPGPRATPGSLVLLVQVLNLTVTVTVGLGTWMLRDRKVHCFSEHTLMVLVHYASTEACVCKDDLAS